jgi:hypothetical protein
MRKILAVAFVIAMTTSTVLFLAHGASAQLATTQTTTGNEVLVYLRCSAPQGNPMTGSLTTYAYTPVFPMDTLFCSTSYPSVHLYASNPTPVANYGGEIVMHVRNAETTASTAVTRECITHLLTPSQVPQQYSCSDGVRTVSFNILAVQGDAQF